MAVVSELSMLMLLLIVCAASVLGGLVFMLRRNWSEEALAVMVGIGAGLLLGLTLLDLLPHSIRHGGERVGPFVMTGFLFVFVLERFSPKRVSLPSSSMLSVIAGFVLHAYLEGLSLMAALDVIRQQPFPLLGALILHRIPDAMTVASFLMTATGSRVYAFGGAVVLGLATLFGAASLGVVGPLLVEEWSGVMMATASGIFLYVAASHLVPLSQRPGYGRMSLFFFLAVLAYLAISLVSEGVVHGRV